MDDAYVIFIKPNGEEGIGWPLAISKTIESTKKLINKFFSSSEDYDVVDADDSSGLYMSKLSEHPISVIYYKLPIA